MPQAELMRILVGLGLPVAVLALFVVAAYFWSKAPRFSRAALGIGIALVAILGAIQVYQFLTGDDITIVIEPEGATASKAARPVDLSVKVMRRLNTLASTILPGESQQTVSSRPLTIQAVGDSFAVKYRDASVGLLDQGRFRQLGWHPDGEEGPSSGRPRYWYTHRVLAGDTARLGETASGTLLIKAIQFADDGTAEVTLMLPHQTPSPRTISIPNKGLKDQAFPEKPPYYIALREADFTADPPWAAFSVFTVQ